MFVCTHNSARSQMAEGWLRHLYRDYYDAFSAGIAPGALNPLAVRVMKEAGIDISSQLGGTGLGLAIAKHIVQLHGGKIQVQSKLGHGTTFKVWLPLVQAQI